MLDGSRMRAGHDAETARGLNGGPFNIMSWEAAKG
jgi:hypothetical protein